MASKPTGPKPVDSLRHQDKRANIPTNELRGFVEGDESAPGAMLYPRDPSLDPQLVWKGKDEQDRQTLEVPVVPVYIQEKILPQAIIENLRDTARKGEPEPEMTLFNDYDGIEFQELVEFYRHEQNWANRMILGDSLVVSRELLSETGSIFVQIGDENVHLVRAVMDEVFGSENFVSLITFRTTANLFSDYLGRNSDFILWYGKQRDSLKYRQLYSPRGYEDDIGGRFTRVELPDGTRRVMSTDERRDIGLLESGSRIYRHDNLVSSGATSTSTVPYAFEGRDYHPGSSRHWKTNLDGLDRLCQARRLAAPTTKSLTFVRYLGDFPLSELTAVWSDTQTGAFTDDKVYVVQTNTKVIERCLLMATDPGDLVLDPTSVSYTH